MDGSVLVYSRKDLRKLGFDKHRSTFVRWEKKGILPPGELVGGVVYYPAPEVHARFRARGLM